MSNQDTWWFRNARTRTELTRKTTPTILFKTLFPDYATFTSALVPYGLKTTWISSVQFMRLQSMIANSYLRYKTDVKNFGFIAMKIEELNGIKEREDKIYSLDPSALLDSLSTQEQKFFTINRSEVDVVTEDYLDNSNTSKVTNQAPYITQIQELLKNAKMVNPELTYLYRIATSILYPLQHNIVNRQDNEYPNGKVQQYVK